MARRVPPGRAGRLWLHSRLEVARRAEDLLDGKERLLRAEELRTRELAERATTDWETGWRDAATWTRRAALVGGQRDLRPGGTGRATAEITWKNTMGITYPFDAVCSLPPEPPGPSPNPAFGPAVDANRQALDAAVRHAAAVYAHKQVLAELATTRRRRRAISDRWIPDLERSLAELDARLDEMEREEHVRIRWTQRHGATRRQFPAGCQRRL